MEYKYSLVAAGAIIAILLTVAVTTVMTSPTANFVFEKSVSGDVTNCVQLRIQCKSCNNQPYNWRGRQMCGSLCNIYFDKCYEKIVPVTPFVRG